MGNCTHTRISTHGKCLDCGMQVYDSTHLNKKGSTVARATRRDALGYDTTAQQKPKKVEEEHDKVH